MKVLNPVQSTTTAISLPTVNRGLRAAGIRDKLVRGNGYFYFVGVASDWADSKVGVYNITDKTVAEWVDAYRRLEREADRDAVDRANEERYFKRR